MNLLLVSEEQVVAFKVIKILKNSKIQRIKASSFGSLKIKNYNMNPPQKTVIIIYNRTMGIDLFLR
jgi:hypothetical protein